MLTPYEFFMRFHDVCGKSAELVWQRLTVEDVQYLAEDADAWKALETFKEIIISDYIDVDPCNELHLPMFSCHGCTHYFPIQGSDPMCSKTLKPLPIKNICKKYEI